MALTERWASLRAADSGKAIFILDASESAARQWDAIVGLARAVFGALPVRIERDLYFLANPNPYSSADFSTHAAQWAHENRRRASLIGPNFATLHTDEAKIVVLGSGTVYDLEDWADTAVLDRTLFVSFGDPLRGGVEGGEEIAVPSATELARRIDDPILSVEISGPGFMPFTWDNHEYELAMQGERISLVSHKADDCQVSLGFLAPELTDVAFTATHSSGRCIRGPLSQAEPSQRRASGVRFSVAEAAAFEKAARHLPFDCPRCGGAHDWDVLRCLEVGSILGEPVYPSLESQGRASLCCGATAAVR
ncbi:MAG: hypothetical protein M1570_02885 [Chloroflexi bacterium]|nr:hypothetical protein [Chloroflexota bacterium]